MAGVETLIEQIRQKARNYVPSLQTQEVLRSTTFVAVIGPFAVGKSTVVKEIVKANPDFGYLRGFTTRERRSDEDQEAFEFIPHSEHGLTSILKGMHNGDLVQIAIHPTTNRIYGSYVKDYQKPYSIKEILASAVNDLRKLPFGNFEQIGLVCEPQDFLARAKERIDPAKPEEHQARMKEAQASLAWLLIQGPELAWVNNEKNRHAQTAAEIVGLVKGERNINPSNRQIGEELLNVINLELAA